MTEEFRRDVLLSRAMDRSEPWDVVVIGGGATGLGSAVDAAARGYATLLVEQSDFGKGTSSRSTKLVHGGVRYLRQGHFPLVFEALRERGRLLRNAPHLTRNIDFVIPCYRWWERPFYGAGLKAYDALALGRSLGASAILSRAAAGEMLPGVRTDGLRGGVRYHDGQFDDARLALNLAQTAVERGAVVLNYARAAAITKRHGRAAGVIIRDLEGQKEWEIGARAVINATGVFADEVRRMDRSDAEPMIRPSQGAHLVLDRSFLPGAAAMLVPSTDDGRVLFAVPWYNRVIVGTTDTPLDDVCLEPRPLEAEIAYLLDHIGRYLNRAVSRSDVRSIYAGIRPLVSAGAEDGDTAALSRDHVLRVAPSGLVTITGGKWTTYRNMAEEAIDRAADVGSLSHRPCTTHQLKIHGWTTEPMEGPRAVYGADAEAVDRMAQSTPGGGALIHPALPVRRGDVQWAVRREMARTVDDVLARRTRAILLDARASDEAASEVAKLIAAELGRDGTWVDRETRRFRELASAYIPDDAAPDRSAAARRRRSLSDGR